MIDHQTEVWAERHRQMGLTLIPYRRRRTLSGGSASVTQTQCGSLCAAPVTVEQTRQKFAHLGRAAEGPQGRPTAALG